MRKSLTIATLACFLLLDISGPWWPREVEAAPAPSATEEPAPPPADTPAVDAAVKDYQTVRKVTLALAILGFIIGLIRLGIAEFPAERHRAETLVGLMAVVFVLVAADRAIARGVAGWFNLSPASLPPFWR